MHVGRLPESDWNFFIPTPLFRSSNARALTAQRGTPPPASSRTRSTTSSTDSAPFHAETNCSSGTCHARSPMYLPPVLFPLATMSSRQVAGNGFDGHGQARANPDGYSVGTIAPIRLGDDDRSGHGDRDMAEWSERPEGVYSLNLYPDRCPQETEEMLPVK